MKIKKFWAQWCAPCKMQETFLENFVNQGYTEEKGYHIERIDVGEDDEAADKYHVSNIPTLVITDDDDNEIKRFIGLTQTNKLIEFVESVK